MQLPQTLSIIVADDHAVFRCGVVSLLSANPLYRVVAQAANGRELVTLTEKWQPDIILTDINMPVMDGTEATRTITARFPWVNIIALSMYSGQESMLGMLHAGAKGYLLKNTDPAQIFQCIEAVAGHNLYYPFDAPAHSESGEKKAKHTLTAKECDIIRYTCQEACAKEIADKLRSTKRAVEAARERIREKIGAKNLAGIVVFAIRSGIFKI